MKEQSHTSLLWRLRECHDRLNAFCYWIESHWEDVLLYAITATIVVLMAVLPLLMLTSCGSDGDDTPTEEPSADNHGVEVCIVFAPRDLGDQGYADRLLAGLFQFDGQLSEADYDRVQLRYMTTSDAETLHEQLRQWNIQGGSPYTRQPYERRLLVLTSASQLQYLSDTPLSDTDEVLVVNVVDSVFEQAPRYDWLGPRLHSLCISAAEGARKLCGHIDYQFSRPEEFGRERAVYLMQYNFDYSHPDSLYEVLRDHFGADLHTTVLPRTATGIDIDRAFQMGEAIQNGGAAHISYAVLNCGYYNPFIYGYFFTQGTGVVETTYLDSDFQDHYGSYPSIVRHYDRALCQWLTRWLADPSAMPQKEWHGAWDGYATDNIETYE